MSNETPDDSTIAPGMELLRVNGRDVAEIVARLLPGVSGDGFIETGRRAVLARELPRRLWLHGVRGDSFALVARDARGRTVRATLPGVRERERAGARNPVNARLRDALARLEAPPGNVSLELFGDSAARLRVRAFGGEETGGGYDGNTSGLNALVVLPHSRLRTKVMMYGYWNAVRPAAQPGRGTIPEHVVPRRVADLLDGNDRALARALALLAASAAR
ncbi:MAG: hypothetical protein ACJ8AO_13490 [Gemmatimonadaceae bacterium]